MTREIDRPGCRIVGSVTIEWLTTEADDQSSLHCVVVLTGFSALQCREGGATLVSAGSHETCVGCRQPEIRRMEL